jgi:peptidoglycan DL-endopeptidase CwlO
VTGEQTKELCVVSHRLKRSISGALVITVVTAAGFTSTPVLADPQLPPNASDAAKQLRDLSHQAEVLTEDFKKAQDDHAARRADLARANAEAGTAERVADQARAEEEKFRGQVDRLTMASYEGARMNKLSALLISKSPNDFLDRASTLEVLAKDNDDVVRTFSQATARAAASEQQAHAARDRAATAEADAARIEGEISQKKAAMDAQVAKVKQQVSSLSKQDRDSLFGGDSNVGLIGGSGAAIAAVNAALGKQGRPYVYGATGPNDFDCSGLVQWAFGQAGVSLPRSTQSQVHVGRSVSQGDLKPGDLIFFYSDNSHVGIYVGGGNVVHAPTEGENVKVTPYKYIGDVSAMRRVAG